MENQWQLFLGQMVVKSKVIFVRHSILTMFYAVPNDQQTQTYSSPDSNGLINTTSTLTVNLNTSSDGNQYTCEADSDALNAGDANGPGTISVTVSMLVIGIK